MLAAAAGHTNNNLIVKTFSVNTYFPKYLKTKCYEIEKLKW